MKPGHLNFKIMYGNISVQLSLYWILAFIDFENTVSLELWEDEAIFWVLAGNQNIYSVSVNPPPQVIPVDSPAIPFFTFMNPNPRHFNQGAQQKVRMASEYRRLASVYRSPRTWNISPQWKYFWKYIKH